MLDSPAASPAPHLPEDLVKETQVLRDQRGSGMGNHALGKVAKASGTCQLEQGRRRAVSTQICCLDLEDCNSSLQEKKKKCLDLAPAPTLGGIWESRDSERVPESGSPGSMPL